MKKNIENGTDSKIVEVNGFSQTMDEADYSLVEQYMLDQIEEEQMLEDQVEQAVTTAAAIVNPRIVKEIYDDFMKKPYSVFVRFYNEDGCLVMKIHMDFLKESHEHLVFTDTKFIGLVMRAMRNIEFEKWEEYIMEAHDVMATIEDPRIDIFRQFMNSKLKRCFYKDYISPAAKTYACVSFIIDGLKEIRFCQERTSEIDNIISPKTT